MIRKPSTKEKLTIVIEKNTYFQARGTDLEKETSQVVEKIVNSIKKLRSMLESVKKESLLNNELKKILAKFLQEDEYGIDSLLALCGLSHERLYRIITLLRLACEVGIILQPSNWMKVRVSEEGEWRLDEIKKRLKNDREFAEDIADILLGRNNFVMSAIADFDAKKLTPSKFLSIPDSDDVLDTLVRYSIFGSYNAKKGVESHKILEKILNELKIRYEKGKVKGIRRSMNAIIPDKKNPRVFIQCCHVGTTSSGMGDRAKTELGVREDINRMYPGAIFILFVDGIGWIVRKGDLERLVEAGDYVFTYHEDCLREFKELLLRLLPKEAFKTT